MVQTINIKTKVKERLFINNEQLFQKQAEYYLVNYNRLNKEYINAIDNIAKVFSEIKLI